MKKALAMSDKTRGFKAKLFKHGLNGGRVSTVLAGNDLIAQYVSKGIIEALKAAR